MSYIKIKRNGAFECYDASDKFQFVIPKDKLEKYLSGTVRLEDGITLDEVLKAWPRVFDFIPYDFKEYLEELKKPSVKIEGDRSKIIFLELEQPINIIEFEDADTDNDLQLFPCFHGRANDVDMAYSLSFLPVNELKDLPIKINHANSAYLSIKKDGKLIHREVKPGKYDTNYDPSVLDFYYNIVYELTWHGSPKEREQKLKELNETIKDAREHPENLLTMDEFGKFKKKLNKENGTEENKDEKD